MKLAELRLNQGLSVRLLAERAEVPIHVVHHAEKGGVPRTENAHRIATVLGVQVTDLWPIEEAAA